MKKKMIDPDMPVGKLIRIKDTLPPPSELAFPLDTIKVTIALNRKSVEFFKRQAAKRHTKYQRMIRELVDRYVDIYHAA